MSVFLTASVDWLPEARALAARRLGDADVAHDVVMDCLLECEAAIGRRLVPICAETGRYYFFRALERRLTRPPARLVVPHPEADSDAAPCADADAVDLVQRMHVAAHDEFPGLVYLSFVLTWAGLSSRQVEEHLGISHSRVIRYNSRVLAWLKIKFGDEWEER